MKFIADRTLGQVVKKLRVLGFDAVYWRGGNLEGAVKAALAEERVLITRSHRIQKKNSALRFLVVEANDPREQIQEVITKLRLRPTAPQFFSRCLLCNEVLAPLPKEEAEGRVPDFIYRTYDSFHSCPSCQRVYWPGTHWQKMAEEMKGMIREG